MTRVEHGVVIPSFNEQRGKAARARSWFFIKICPIWLQASVDKMTKIYGAIWDHNAEWWYENQLYLPEVKLDHGKPRSIIVPDVNPVIDSFPAIQMDIKKVHPQCGPLSSRGIWATIPAPYY
jgi:hypothetical protein